MSYVTKHTNTFSTQTKHSNTFQFKPVQGLAWAYNQAGLTYNQTTESQTGLSVLYNSIGTAVTYSYQTKH